MKSLEINDLSGAACGIRSSIPSAIKHLQWFTTAESDDNGQNVTHLVHAGTVPLRYSSPRVPLTGEPHALPQIPAQDLPLKAWKALREISEYEPPMYHPPELVYFIEAIGIRRVKIGYSQVGVPKRIKSIMTGCPAPIKTLRVIYGGRAEEQLIHRIFRIERLTGEWFKASRRLRTFISALEPLDCRVLEEKRKWFLIYPNRDQHERDAAVHAEESLWADLGLAGLRKLA